MANGIDWFRWHHGSVTDPKFQLVARRAGCRLPDVIAAWAFVLEQASASSDRGTYGDLDFESIDLLMGFDDGVTQKIVAAMEARGLLVDGMVASWTKRQVKRERADDNSTERVKAFREKQRQETQEAGDETPGNATQRQETPREEKSREEKKREEKEESGDSSSPSATAKPSQPVQTIEGVPESLLKDWKKVRAAKRAGPISQTVIDALQREAAAACITVEQAVRTCVERGWQGFKAEWYAGSSGTPAAPGRAAPVNKQEALEQRNRSVAEAWAANGGGHAAA
ncbi:hypothetical protein N5C96_29285 [Delftia tsuruhatensis]|uniref:hypothetical protein n=1 Tax=Delftia tsuruhatensis TaxID=180282 RepID=UPI002443AE49|nr:hypothetical protein [Delftia tsuruhatensis]MDH0777513.1 hypothetical protein [Delftia tsuruhatensis]MDH1461844.1 hypothetical protein [Delftia tsuruhatensis]WGG09977.1 hypothetical protein N5O86_25535 [Delftia tsuruhatensis]